MAESTHRAEVVPVVLKKHPNADSLSIVEVYDGGYQVVVRTEDWANRDKGVYIQPDSIVPDTEDFKFLNGKLRIKARKFRGEWSTGLLFPVPDDVFGVSIGDDLAAVIGITHYDPPEPNLKTGGEAEKPPRVRKKCPSCDGLGIVEDPQHGHSAKCTPCDGKGYPNDAETVGFNYPTYEVESFRKYAKQVFEPGEPVWVTEKIHGCNGRWMFNGERFYCGSRTEWKRQSEENLWWKALELYPNLKAFLEAHPGVCAYGEVYGQVQDLRYGTKKGEYKIAIFDLLGADGKWVEPEEAYTTKLAWDLPWVPILQTGIPFDFETLLAMAEGPSTVLGADNIREGVVVKPVRERWNAKVQGRLCMKIVGNSYLERA